MTASKSMLKLAGAALALTSMAMLVVGLLGLGPPLGVENWGLVLAMMSGCASAILFIHADDPENDRGIAQSKS